MAGHSKWANIQHRKGRQDAARSKLFSKLAKEITVAAKMGDPDPEKNPRLRLAVKEAKSKSVPKDVIDRAIKKSQGGDAETYDEIRYEGLTRDEGRIAGQLDIDRTVRGFGTHALNSDAWLVARFDRSQGPRQHTFYNSPLTSLDHRGATGPALACSQGTTIEYFGEETITVRAGSFACHHFAYVVVATDHPEYHLWVTTDGDFIFVKGTVEAPYNWSFELTELIDTP